MEGGLGNPRITTKIMTVVNLLLKVPEAYTFLL